MPTSKLQDLTINPTKQIEDTIDLTKQYHNLLQRREDTNTTTYTWDSNVLHAVGNGANESISTNEPNHYQYLQDELGSPIRLLTEEGVEQEVYGYDEFGQETISSNNQAGFIQPFTYTGYQRDGVANTYYAQAREYVPRVGRFNGEDIVKGNVVQPFTLNPYPYCWNQPMSYLDVDGRDAILVNKVVDNFVGIEHMSGFFQDENGDWNFFFWGPTVEVHKVQDTSIFSDMDSINEYLYANDLYAKENKAYRDSVYIKGDFSQSVVQANKLLEVYTQNYEANKNRKIPNREYNFFTNNCGHVTMELFMEGTLPGGTNVGAYMARNGYGNSLIPNWNMINMQGIFYNSSTNSLGFDEAMALQRDKFENAGIFGTWWYSELASNISEIDACE